MSAARKIDFAKEGSTLIPHVIAEDMAQENLRHDVTVMMIQQGWTQKTLGEVYGEATGETYNRNEISYAVNGKRKYRSLTLDLFDWMKTHKGPRFN